MRHRYPILFLCILLIAGTQGTKNNNEGEKREHGPDKNMHDWTNSNTMSREVDEHHVVMRPYQTINIDDQPPQADMYSGDGEDMDDDYSGSGFDDEDSDEEGSAADMYSGDGEDMNDDYSGSGFDDEDSDEEGSAAGLLPVPTISSVIALVQGKLNTRPIVGVLAQETNGSYPGDTYFFATYVQYLEQSGARVVPIRVGENEQYYKQLFSYINGVVFPGGDVSVTTSLYAKAAQVIYKLAVEANDRGDYFPLWGTCLGFELFSVLTSGKNLLSSCDAQNYVLPLDFTKDALDSRLVQHMPSDIFHTLKTYNVTSNFHHYCLTPQTINKSNNLRSFYKVVSTNTDKKGLRFVSLMEANRYPFYGSQFHPEANSYRWALREHVNHSAAAVIIAQYFSNFFISEARKSGHHFPNLQEESAALIYNYQPLYMGAPTFHNIYLFNLTKHTGHQDKIMDNDMSSRN